MRWYRIHSIRICGCGSMELETIDNVVQANGIEDAFNKVKALGWWPVSALNSAWAQSEV